MNLWKIYENEIPMHLAEVANVPSLQRLKDIGMSCGCEYTSFARFKNCPSYSRYDHSMGVALIIWHFTNDVQQSIAGLLHDIATPTFSHVVDFLHKDYLKQEYTELNTREMILADKKLLLILKRYGLSVNDVEDYHRFPIADNASPQLSADRLEYTLGNLIHYGIRDLQTVKRYFQNIIVAKNEMGIPEIMFESVDLAEAFAKDALSCAKVYTSDEDRFAMQKLADVLRNAIKDGVITEKNLYETETSIINKFQANTEYKSKWNEYCSYNRVISSKYEQAGNKWILVNAKKRHIDPYVIGKGRISYLSKEFKKELDSYIKEDFQYWICGVTLL